MNALQGLFGPLTTPAVRVAASDQGVAGNNIINKDLNLLIQHLPGFAALLAEHSPGEIREQLGIADIEQIDELDVDERQMIAGNLLPAIINLPVIYHQGQTDVLTQSSAGLDITTLPQNRPEQQLGLDQKLINDLKAKLSMLSIESVQKTAAEITLDGRQNQLPVQEQVELSARQGVVINADTLNQKVIAALMRNHTDPSISQQEGGNQLSVTKAIDKTQLMDLVKLFEVGTPQANQHTDKPLLKLETPIQDSAWVKNFSTRVNWMLNQRVHSADIMLEPPELGKLDIRIAIDKESASILILTPHGAVKDSLEAAIPRLRDLFSDNGLDLVQVNVESEDRHAETNSQSSKDSQELTGNNTMLISDSEISSDRGIDIYSTSLVDYFI